MSTTDAVPAEATSTGKLLAEVDGAVADPETVVTEFSTKTWRDDLTLVVEDTQLYVSKAVLAFASPVFDEMFTPECQEKDKGEITLHGKSLDNFVEFLKCLYPGIMKPVTLENVFKVLPLVNEYQVQILKSACEVCLFSLLSSNKTKIDVYVVLEQACTYGLDQVKEKCIDTVAERPYEEFDEAAKRFSFPVDVQNEIRKKCVKALSVKYKNMCGHVKTSEALNRFFGDIGSHRDLVKNYLGGRVGGDYIHLEVSSKYNVAAEMYINNLHFNLLVHQQGYHQVCVQIKCNTKRTVNCVCAVFVYNWMKGKADTRDVDQLQFSTKRDTVNFHLKDLMKKDVEDESAGFMYGGKMNFYIYIFCMEG